MSTMKPKIMKAMEKLGTANGHAAPKSQDPSDELMHEYYVCSLAESYFKKRRENAKKAMIVEVPPTQLVLLEKAIKTTEEKEIGDTVTLSQGQYYTTTATIKNGASFLDTQALKVALLKRMKTDEVEKLFEDASSRRRPTVSYNVTENL